MENKSVNIFINTWRMLVQPNPGVIDSGDRRRALLTAATSLILLLSFAIAFLIVIISGGRLDESGTYLLLYALPAIFIAFWLSRTRFYTYGGFLLLLVLLYITIADVPRLIDSQGVSRGVSFLNAMILFTIVLASTILRTRNILILSVISIGTYIFILAPYSDSFRLFVGDFGVVLTVSVLITVTSGYRSATEQEQIAEIKHSNEELRIASSELELRVEERTGELNRKSEELIIENERTKRRANQLQTISDLSNTISTYQELSGLLPRVASLIAERFNFYHVGIFLVDRKKEYAVFSSTNSDGGYKMLERGHRLRIGEEGIVGLTAASGRAQVVSDTESDIVFFNNPDLPETRAEAAIPLRYANQTIGILDMQSLNTNAFELEDIEVLTALANQVAIAISNVRALEEARRSIEQASSLNREYTATNWKNLTHRRENIGVRYSGASLENLSQPITSPEIKAALQKGNTETTNNTTALPIILRGEVIGVINVRVPQNHKWTPDERDILQSVSERVALALENARLIEDAQARAEQERGLAEMGNKISSSFRFDTILRTAAEELSRALNGSDVLVQMTPQQDKAE